MRGKRDDALTLLENVYGKFVEGFDTTDMRAARELLQSLMSVVVRVSVSRATRFS
jgi:hypothetical protein